jgi:hypothetical protein
MLEYVSQINKRFEISSSKTVTGVDFDYCSWQETYFAMRCPIPYGGEKHE